VEDEVFFIRKVVAGRGSKSYGIQVAKLAGLPAEVIESARNVVKRMEHELASANERAKAGGERVIVQKEVVLQEHPVLEELRAINVERISPIEALNMLYEVKQKLQQVPPGPS
jgi:DNA mismatch repair protein MutS